MQVGDLVKPVRGMLGVIVEVPTEDDYWGSTAIIQWIGGDRAEHTEEEFKILGVANASR